MSWLSKFLHPEKGYEKGQEQLDKYYGQSQGYLNPYNQYGQAAYGGLSGAMNNLLNPEQLYDKWSKGYEQSSAAKSDIDDAMRYGLDAASSMGLNGSSAALNAMQGGAANIGQHDKQQYLNDLMQKYLAGAGIGQNIFGAGANAAGQMSNNANQMGQNSAEMAYGKQNAQGNLFGSLLGKYLDSTAAAAGSMATGGATGGMSGGGGWNIGR